MKILLSLAFVSLPVLYCSVPRHTCYLSASKWVKVKGNTMYHPQSTFVVIRRAGNGEPWLKNKGGGGGVWGGRRKRNSRQDSEASFRDGRQGCLLTEAVLTRVCSYTFQAEAIQKPIIHSSALQACQRFKDIDHPLPSEMGRKGILEVRFEWKH